MLVTSNPQRVGHDLGVKSGVQYHDGSVHATIQEVFGKLLQGGGERRLKGEIWNPDVWPGLIPKSIQSGLTPDKQPIDYFADVIVQ